jgi:hypothetical protein
MIITVERMVQDKEKFWVVRPSKRAWDNGTFTSLEDAYDFDRQVREKYPNARVWHRFIADLDDGLLREWSVHTLRAPWYVVGAPSEWDDSRIGCMVYSKDNVSV